MWLVLAALAAAPVALQVDPCVEAGVGFERQVALELDETLAAPAQIGPVTLVRLRCEQDEVVVEVTDPFNGTVSARRVDPGGVSAAARRRLLAITTAECVGASRLTPDARAPLVAKPPRAPALDTLDAPPLVDGSARPDPVWIVSGQLRGATFLGSQHALGGGLAIGLERLLFWRLWLRAEVAIDAAAERESLGSLWLLSGSASLGPQLRLALALPVTFGVAARVGFVRLEGAPDDAASSDGFTRAGPWVGVLGYVWLRVAPFERGGVNVGVEGGGVALPFTGLRSDGRQWGVAGGWVSLQLGWELPW